MLLPWPRMGQISENGHNQLFHRRRYGFGTPTRKAMMAGQTAAWAKAKRLPAPSLFALSPDGSGAPGKAVFRDALIELIQYLPTTASVGPQPVLMVPTWIRADGLRDLSFGHALIKWLVAQGRTVFAIAWRNPDANMHETPLEDDRAACVMATLDIVGLICDDAKVHAVGYGQSSAMLSLIASVMAHDADDRLASVSLFALQPDFAMGGLDLLTTDETLQPLRYSSRTAVAALDTPSPPTWAHEIVLQDVSWWPQWAAWLARNSGPPTEPPPMDFALGDAHGFTILEV